MFGENKIIGSEKIKVNSKNEMRLPNFTGTAENDHLVVVRSKGLYIIINSIDYYNLIKEYELAKQDAKKYKESKNTIRNLYSSIVDTIKCSKNSKIKLPMEIKEKEFYCIGENKHLVLRKVNRR